MNCGRAFAQAMFIAAFRVLVDLDDEPSSSVGIGLLLLLKHLQPHSPSLRSLSFLLSEGLLEVFYALFLFSLGFLLRFRPSKAKPAASTFFSSCLTRLDRAFSTARPQMLFHLPAVVTLNQSNA